MDYYCECKWQIWMESLLPSDWTLQTPSSSFCRSYDSWDAGSRWYIYRIPIWPAEHRNCTVWIHTMLVRQSKLHCRFHTDTGPNVSDRAKWTKCGIYLTGQSVLPSYLTAKKQFWCAAEVLGCLFCIFPFPTLAWMSARASIQDRARVVCWFWIYLPLSRCWPSMLTLSIPPLELTAWDFDGWGPFGQRSWRNIVAWLDLLTN